MIKYCLAIFGGMLLANFIHTTSYESGVRDGIIQEKFHHLDNKQYKIFLEDSDIPKNYQAPESNPTYKL